jgi:hypothetical protein
LARPEKAVARIERLTVRMAQSARRNRATNWQPKV